MKIFSSIRLAINGVSVGDNNLISAGEVLFDSISNDIVFQFGLEYQMTKAAVMQPYLFPYLGYFQLINAVDDYVFLDDVN